MDTVLMDAAWMDDLEWIWRLEGGGQMDWGGGGECRWEPGHLGIFTCLKSPPPDMLCVIPILRPHKNYNVHLTHLRSPFGQSDGSLVPPAPQGGVNVVFLHLLHLLHLVAKSLLKAMLGVGSRRPTGSLQVAFAIIVQLVPWPVSSP